MEFDPWEKRMAAVDRAHARLCAASADLLEAVASLAELEEEAEEPITTWLAPRYQEGSATVDHWVRVGEALRDLPAIQEGHREGWISWDQLKPLTKFATAETDQHHAQEASRMSPAQLWRKAQRHRRTEVQEEAETAHQLRHAWMGWDEDRSFLQLYAELPAEQGARVERALAQRAQEVVLEEGLPLYDRAGARLADALTELVTSEVGQPPTDTLVLHADARVVTEEGDPGLLGETGSGIQLADETIRRLACDAKVEWVAEADGRTVGIGRQARVVPGWMRRQLEHRDPECRFDGCGRTKWLVIHHVVPWARGGRTDLDSLIRVCTTHHRALHEGGWKVTGHPDRKLRFHDPGGRVLGAPPEVNRALQKVPEPTLDPWNAGSSGWRTSTG
ncbi:MAG: DUF222 domain-containing protein [Actinomycetota bacterium]